MSTEITLIKKLGPNPLMSKRVYLDELGTMKSDASQCLMVMGTATRAPAETARSLADHILSCGSDAAIALGALKPELPSPATITVPSRMATTPGAITRSREFIDYRAGARV